ncbi:MAG: GNAT family N-acetyltransferase [Acidimicrobiia bacterium]
MTPEVRDNPEASRYEVVAGDRVLGYADYRIHGDVVIFPHTVVAPEMRGQGLGEVLVQGALDDVRASGRRVVASCWFVAEFIDARTQYQDLLAG